MTKMMCLKKKSRSCLDRQEVGSNLREVPEVQQDEQSLEANEPVLKAVPATDDDRRFFLDECFKNEKGDWMKLSACEKVRE